MGIKKAIQKNSRKMNIKNLKRELDISNSLLYIYYNTFKNYNTGIKS